MPASDESGHWTSGKEQVLLIEDDPDVAALVSQILEEQDYRVDRAGSAEEGQSLFDPLTYDLILVDGMLPGMSGWEFCLWLKSRQPRPYVPIMMLTARGSLKERVRSLDAGADDFLIKPFDIDELVAHVRAMLRIRSVELLLWRHVRDFEALYAIASTVNSSLDLATVLERALRNVVETSGAKVGAIWLYEGEPPELRLTAHVGLSAEQADLVRAIGRPRALAHSEAPGGTARAVLVPSRDSALASVVPALLTHLHVDLISKGTRLGVLALATAEANGFPESLARLLSTMALSISVAIDNARLYAQTRHMADTDQLTDLYNHRYIREAIELECSRFSRSQRPFSVVMIDLDQFKNYNDRHGHPSGDVLLQEFARLLLGVCRKTDFVGRYGGDEFIVLAPETSAEQVNTLATRIQEAAFSLFSSVQPGANLVSISMGIAVCPFDGTQRDELINAADRALYEAKALVGKSRIARAEGQHVQGGPLGAFEALINELDRRTGYSRRHSELSAQYAMLLARQLDLPENEQRAVGVAGLLHDIGNLGVPRRLLMLQGPLSEEDRAVIERHVYLSHVLIDQIPYLAEVLEAVLNHHEYYDGSGYPRGLSRESIPRLGRLLAVATAFAAMRAARPYREALSREAALDELEREAGQKYDPTVVQAFRAALAATDDDPAR